MLKGKIKMIRMMMVFLILLMSGCATLIVKSTTASPREKYYMGTKVDASILAQPFHCSKETDVCEAVKTWPYLWPLALVDLPLSMVLDTMCFPFEYQKQAHEYP
jgi:uncharacterized protein YceK